MLTIFPVRYITFLYLIYFLANSLYLLIFFTCLASPPTLRGSPSICVQAVECLKPLLGTLHFFLVCFKRIFELQFMILKWFLWFFPHLNLTTTPWMKLLVIILLFRWGNWGFSKLRGLSKSIRKVSESLKRRIKFL